MQKSICLSIGFQVVLLHPTKHLSKNTPILRQVVPSVQNVQKLYTKYSTVSKSEKSEVRYIAAAF